MSNSDQRKKGAILSYISIIVNTLVQLVYTPYVIKMLGQSEYGLYSLVYSIIGYLTVLDLGFGNAIIVYTAKYRAKKEYEQEKKLHGMFFIIFCIMGAIAVLLGIILYLNVDNLFGNTMTSIEMSKIKIMMLILTFNIAITFIFNIYTSIIIAYEKFIFQKLMTILNTFLKPLLMIPLLIKGYKSITMTMIITIINVMIMIANYIYCRKKLNIKIKFYGFDKVLFKEVFGYSFFIFLGVIVDKINWNVDQFVLGAVSGTVAVSIYAIASQLNQLFINLSTAISSVFLTKVSKMIANDENNHAITKEFIKIGRIQYLIIFLMCSGLVLFGKQFIVWWAGPDFIESYYVALLLIIPICFPLIQNLGISIMQAMNKHKFKAISTFIMALINIIISILLARKYGAIGSALGTAVSLITCNVIIINIYYYKIIKIDVLKFWREILKMTIPFTIPIILILILMNLTNLTGIKSVIVYGSIYTFIYCIIAYHLSMNAYEKNIINKILRKIKLVK